MVVNGWRKLGVVTLIWIVGAFTGVGCAWFLLQGQIDATTHSQNGIVCVVRGIIVPAQARSAQTARDATQSESARLRAANGVKTDETVLRSLITVPRRFDCSKFKP